MRAPESLVALLTVLCLSQATCWMNRLAGWSWIMSPAPLPPRGQPAKTHTNKNKNYCNNRQLALHWQTAVVHFSPSSSLTCPSIWIRNVVPIPSIMKTYILVRVISNIHNYPGCNSMIDHKLNRPLRYLLQLSCSSDNLIGIDSAIYHKPDIYESSACQPTITISDSNTLMGEYELSISDSIPSLAEKKNYLIIPSFNLEGNEQPG